MPLTPYHMGPAFPVKVVSGRAFSLLLYGYTQVLIDLEVLYHMVNRDDYLHGFFHSFFGASLVGVVALATGKPLFGFWLRTWNQIRKRVGTSRFDFGEQIGWKCGGFSVWVGSWLHVFLDAFMHRDMHPLAPFSTENPFLALVDVRDLYQFCVVTALLGVVLLALRGQIKKPRHESD